MSWNCSGNSWCQVNPKSIDGEAGSGCLLTLSDVCCFLEWLQDLERVLEGVTIICSDGGCIELISLAAGAASIEQIILTCEFHLVAFAVCYLTFPSSRSVAIVDLCTWLTTLETLPRTWFS